LVEEVKLKCDVNEIRRSNKSNNHKPKEDNEKNRGKEVMQVESTSA
jgi:hypothetical protein